MQRTPTMSARGLLLLVAIAMVLGSGVLGAWSPKGHRLVALVATSRLTPVARQTVAWLLDNRSLADVAAWADHHRDDNVQTGTWHYVNIAPGARAYDRERDCPRQPGARAGAPADRWRDCVVDRILYNEDRLRNTGLDRADRAVALKFLVHLVGDLHQPMHTLALERGGNGIAVSAFGSPTCQYDDGTRTRCNLHSVWDGTLITHRGLDERRYLALLEAQTAQHRWAERAGGTPASWAIESLRLAEAALLPQSGQADEAYYRKQIPIVDQQLSLGGLRLAALVNAALTSPPSAR